MNQTELPECEKINKKEPSKDVQMTQKQAERLVEHLKNIFMYVRVLRPDEIGDFIIDEENGKLCECYAVWNKAMPCLNCISEKALRPLPAFKTQKAASAEQHAKPAAAPEFSLITDKNHNVRLTRVDLLCIAVVTLLYGIVAFTNPIRHGRPKTANPPSLRPTTRTVKFSTCPASPLRITASASASAPI